MLLGVDRKLIGHIITICKGIGCRCTKNVPLGNAGIYHKEIWNTNDTKGTRQSTREWTYSWSYWKLQITGAKFSTQIGKFEETDPGFYLYILAELQKSAIQITYFSQKGIHAMKDSKLYIEEDTNCIDDCMKKMRKDYTKLAMLIFYPYQQLSDFMKRKSCLWMFYKQLLLKRKGVQKILGQMILNISNI